MRGDMVRMNGWDDDTRIGHFSSVTAITSHDTNHFRADFTPHASQVLVAKAAGPMAADPADLPWRKLPDSIRRRP